MHQCIICDKNNRNNKTEVIKILFLIILKLQWSKIIKLNNKINYEIFLKLPFKCGITNSITKEEYKAGAEQTMTRHST